jgi:hypothetical protein
MSLLAIALCGAALVREGFPRPLRGAADWVFRVAAALALGVGTWSAAYAAWRMAFGPPGTSKDAILAVAGGAVLLRRRPPLGREPALDCAPRWLVACFVAACAVAAASFVEHTLRFPDGGWDAWMIWNMRARFFSRAADLATAFSPQMSFFAHQDYPWLVPGAVAQLFAIFGEQRQVPAALAALYGALGVAVVTAALAREQGARWGLLGGLAVLTLPGYAVYAWTQQADVPLAVYLAVAIALVTAARSPRELLLGGFAAGLGMWTKNEGTLYAVCIAAALLVRTRDLRAVLAFAAGALPCALLLVWFKVRYGVQTDLAAFSTEQSVLSHAMDLHRWGELVLYTLRRVFYFQEAGPWVAAELLVLAVFARRLPASVAGTALFLACATFGPLYVLQPHPLEWIFRTSAMRILIQLWPAAVVATVGPLAGLAKAGVD